MRKKILAIVTIALCLVTMAVPCFAYTTNDAGNVTGNVNWYRSIVPWDTFVFYDIGTDYAVPFPYASVGVSADEANGGNVFPQIYTDIRPAPFNYPSYISVMGRWNGSYNSDTRRASIDFHPSNLRNDGSSSSHNTTVQKYGLRCGSPFITTLDSLFVRLTTGRFFIPAGADCRYSINIEFVAPGVGSTTEPFYLDKHSYSYESFYVNTTSAQAELIMFPTAENMFGDDLVEYAGESVIITGISWDVVINTVDLVTDDYSFQFYLPYGTYNGPDIVSEIFPDQIIDLWERYPNVEYRYVNQRQDFTSWLASALNGFWTAEFFPGFTFGGLAAVLIGVGVLSFLIKWWLGG